jgi:hypothetical protein
MAQAIALFPSAVHPIGGLVAADSAAPLRFFYTHLHDAIRGELLTLSGSVLLLESVGGEAKDAELQLVRQRYRFLEQVYKYHSSVEDEVGSWVVYMVFSLPIMHYSRDPLSIQAPSLASSACPPGYVPCTRFQSKERHPGIFS